MTPKTFQDVLPENPEGLRFHVECPDGHVLWDGVIGPEELQERGSHEQWYCTDCWDHNIHPVDQLFIEARPLRLGVDVAYESTRIRALLAEHDFEAEDMSTGVVCAPVKPDRMVLRALFMQDVLERHGIHVHPAGSGATTIQASYDPVSRKAFIVLAGVTDQMLKPHEDEEE